MRKIIPLILVLISIYGKSNSQSLDPIKKDLKSAQNAINGVNEFKTFKDSLAVKQARQLTERATDSLKKIENKLFNITDGYKKTSVNYTDLKDRNGKTIFLLPSFTIGLQSDLNYELSYSDYLKNEGNHFFGLGISDGKNDDNVLSIIKGGNTITSFSGNAFYGGRRETVKNMHSRWWSIQMTLTNEKSKLFDADLEEENQFSEKSYTGIDIKFRSAQLNSSGNIFGYSIGINTQSNANELNGITINQSRLIPNGKDWVRSELKEIKALTGNYSTYTSFSSSVNYAFSYKKFENIKDNEKVILFHLFYDGKFAPNNKEYDYHFVGISANYFRNKSSKGMIGLNFGADLKPTFYQEGKAKLDFNITYSKAFFSKDKK